MVIRLIQAITGHRTVRLIRASIEHELRCIGKPNQTQSVMIEGKRLNRPAGVGGEGVDCRGGGYHHYTIGHFFPQNPNFYLQACRRCGLQKITTFVFSDGRLVSKKHEFDDGPKDPQT